MRWQHVCRQVKAAVGDEAERWEGPRLCVALWIVVKTYFGFQSDIKKQWRVFIGVI